MKDLNYLVNLSEMRKFNMSMSVCIYYCKQSIVILTSTVHECKKYIVTDGREDKREIFNLCSFAIQQKNGKFEMIKT